MGPHSSPQNLNPEVKMPGISQARSQNDCKTYVFKSKCFGAGAMVQSGKSLLARLVGKVNSSTVKSPKAIR